MPLTAGTRLGPYEIVGALGAGGMGEVYRARDTRLDRDVAIKILSSNLVAGPELRQRFEREARTISQLSHAHICSLHDIGRQDEVDFLVMEYLEGETLEHRLSRGPLPPDQVVKIAIQIADALDKAHRLGIVHRDLKPGNVMLSKAGAKLMDFGLAKLRTEPAPAVTALDEMATAAGTKKLTAEGMIVGTFQYMAPEQLEGAEADARSDIFALGEVIYEMAAGRPAFTGKTKASLIAAILSSEPKPINDFQPMSPPALERVVRTCLAKDPDDRWQTAHDLKLQLQWIAEAGSQTGLSTPVAQRRKHREWIAWALAVVLLAGLIAAVGFAYRERSRRIPFAVRSSIDPADKQNFSFTGDGGAPPAISPDGSRIVYGALDAQGKQYLWVRSLNSLNAQLLPGSDNATFPFWSADSRKIGFFADGSLKVVDLYGGQPLILCPAPNGRGATWNDQGMILFSPRFRGGLFTVSATGGDAQKLLDQAGTPYSSFRWPQFMPDGKHFIYLAVQHEKGSEGSLWFASLDDPKPKLIMKTSAAARYASGRLLFMRGITLMAQTFDPSSGTLSGEPTAVADQVLRDAAIWRGIFDASANGLLIYEYGTVAAATRMAWLDRTGKQLASVDLPTGFQTMALSRDGKFLAVQGNPSSDIWSYDLSRGVHTRLTFDPVNHSFPTWSPDNQWVAYVSPKNGHADIFRKRADGTGQEEPLYVSAKDKAALDWSSDGKYVLFIQPSDNNKGTDIMALPLQADRKPLPVVQTPFNNVTPVFSPDGKWIAYASDDSGRNEVYVTSFPQATGKWQVSAQGGFAPAWTSNGKEIIYLSPNDNRLFAAQVGAKGGQFVVGDVKPLFRVSGTAQIYSWFAVARSGDKFLAPTPVEQNQPPLTLVTNWTTVLTK